MKKSNKVAWSTSTVGDASRAGQGETRMCEKEREIEPRPEESTELVLVLCKRGEGRRHGLCLAGRWAGACARSACAKYLIQCAKAESKADCGLCS